jgi:hypothetical protein
MGDALNVYCPTCFAMPGEMCRTRYLVHGDDEVTPVICPTHSGRVLDSQKDSIRNAIARQLLAAALMSFRGR